MCYQRKRLWILGVILLTAAVVTEPDLAVGQRKSSGGLTGGDRLRPGTHARQRSYRNTRHALDYSRDIYRYSRDVETVDPNVAKAESQELGERIEAAKKELKVVREEAKGDKDILAALNSIEKHLANAAEHHKQLHAECCKDSVDGVVCMECCNEITKELEKAMAEHAALMRKLEIKEGSGETNDQPSTKNE